MLAFHNFTFFSLGFIFHTLTPQAGCRLSLSMQMFGVHSPSTCWLFQIFLCKFYFSWGLTSFIPSLSKQVVSSHSPSRCWLFQFFLFLMEFHIFYTNTLQAGLGSYSPWRCLVYSLLADVGLFNLFLFNLNFSWGFAYFTLSLSKQVVSSHSPYRCMVYTLQADVGFFFRGEITPLSSSYNISGLVPVCWLLFQCF